MIPSLLLLAVVGMGGLDADAPTDPWKALPYALVLLCMSAFFSGTETALFSLQQGDRQALRSRSSLRHVEKVLQNPRSTLASLLIGNETVNVTLSTVTAGLLFSIAPTLPWINLVVLTPILVLFGEVGPKSIGFRFNRTIAPIVAPLVLGLAWITTPVRWVLMRVADAALVFVGGTTAPKRAQMHEAHLRALVDHGYQSGTIKPMEREVIERVFEFGDLPVSRLMTPRPDMVTLELSKPWNDMLAEVRVQGLSRIPVWSGGRDNIVGILLAKDLLPLIAEPEAPTAKRIQRLLHAPHFIPETKRAGDLLSEFKKGKFHQSLVVDEHGMVVGLITLDDILTELMGDVVEEIDDEVTSDVIALSEGVYTVRGQIDIDDFAARFERKLPEGDYTTLGGFLANQLGAVPTEGDELIVDGMRFTVIAVEKNRVKRVRVHFRRVEESA